MGSRSSHSDAIPRRRWWFPLPSFRAARAVNAEVHGDGSASFAAQEAARLSKAAAWQWHTRGVGDLVVPTRRPFPSAAARGATRLQARHDQKQQPDVHPPAVRSPSRFKAEAIARPPSTGAPSPSPATPSPGSPSLFDDADLSGLRSHMTDFLERLQQEPRPLPRRDNPAARNHDITHPLHPPTAAALEGSASRRPISVFNRLLRKTFSGFLSKNANESRRAKPSAAVEGPPADCPDLDDVQCHYHHYIHHHHHHYHYGNSPEKGAALVRRRRHSESGGARPPVCRSIRQDIMVKTAAEEGDQQEENEEDGEESSPVTAFLARQRERRLSDSAFVHYNKNKGGASAMNWPDHEEAFEKLLQLQFPRRQHSERFTIISNKTPNVGSHARDAELGESPHDIEGRRRHWMESYREGEMVNVRCDSMGPRPEPRPEEERTMNAGGRKKGGRVYRLGGGHVGGGGGRAGIAWRRHSESLANRQAELLVHEQRRESMGGRICEPSPVNMKVGRGYGSPAQASPCRHR